MKERIFRIGLLLAWMAWLFQGWLAVPSALAAQDGPDAQTLSTLPLPDLQTLPPFDLQLIVNPVSKTHLLRFSNSVANTGSGPLHVIGELDENRQTLTLIQQVPGADGSQLTQRLGGFAFDLEHGHWHWDGFSVYEIWSLGLMAEREAILVDSGKVGYCMLDTSRADARWLQSQGLDTLTPAAYRSYTGCGYRRQGISVGWVDTYLRHLPGQSMNVSDLADGVYALRSIVDPEGLLVEQDKTNNDAVVYFRLEGPRLTVLKDVRFARAHIFFTLYGQDLPEERGAQDRF